MGWEGGGSGKGGREERGRKIQEKGGRVGK